MKTLYWSIVTSLLVVVCLLFIMGKFFSVFTPQNTTLASVRCANGSSLQVVKTHYPGTIDVDPRDAYSLVYSTGWFGLEKKKIDYLVSNKPFPSFFKPDYFTWFESITDPANSYWNVWVNNGQDGVFSLEEYLSIESCMGANRSQLNASFGSLRLGSIALIPPPYDQPHPYGESYAETFTCSQGGEINVTYDGRVTINDNSMGSIDSKGFFIQHVDWDTYRAKELKILDTRSSCLNIKDKTLDTAYTAWRTQYTNKLKP